MKVNNTVLCKENLMYEKERSVYFIKNKKYTILAGDGKFIFISCRNDDDIGLWFQIDKNENEYKYNDNYLDFYEYFYTQEEIRLLKLESL
ncbi:hypothetical protein M0Q50_05325 [bacterium]|jgi:hypothetical protein|nr:hypothetical protein [bacterium]